jgi:hypothetical protein
MKTTKLCKQGHLYKNPGPTLENGMEDNGSLDLLTINKSTF